MSQTVIDALTNEVERLKAENRDLLAANIGLRSSLQLAQAMHESQVAGLRNRILAAIDLPPGVALRVRPEFSSLFSGVTNGGIYRHWGDDRVVHSYSSQHRTPVPVNGCAPPAGTVSPAPAAASADYASPAAHPVSRPIQGL